MTLNGIVSHEDWLPTFAAAAGAPDVKEKLLKGVELNGRTYKNHIDGYNLLDYLSGKAKDSPRKEFIYVNDDGEVVAIRVGDWKAIYLENRAHQLDVWREPFVHLRLPLLFNLRRDPFEKSQHNSNTYHDWMIDRAFVLVPLQAVASKFLLTHEGVPAQPDAGRLESRFAGEADQEHDHRRGVANCGHGVPSATAACQFFPTQEKHHERTSSSQWPPHFWRQRKQRRKQKAGRS